LSIINRGLLKKTNISQKEIDYVIMGTVIQEVKTANIAREVKKTNNNNNIIIITINFNYIKKGYVGCWIL
jgi:acetyl-CoA acetyltransferase